MFRLIIAVVLLWTLSTSGLTAGDVAHALVDWTADHVEITVPAAQPERSRQLSIQRPEPVIELGPLRVHTDR